MTQPRHDGLGRRFFVLEADQSYDFYAHHRMQVCQIGDEGRNVRWRPDEQNTQRAGAVQPPEEPCPDAGYPYGVEHPKHHQD